MEKIIGFRRASGTYEGKPYDNFYLVTTIRSRKYYGVSAKETKVKATIVLGEFSSSAVPDADYIEEHPQVLLGLSVDYLYNRFGNVVGVEFDNEPDDDR